MLPGLVLEGHSTDYQTPRALREMVEDGIAILKVGPALTFALREGLFALSAIETELLRYRPDLEASDLPSVLDHAMASHPGNWRKHYHGGPAHVRLARKFSFSDRCRYYLLEAEVQEALTRLLSNLGEAPVPLTLLSQFMPIQYGKVREGQLKNQAIALLKDRIVNCFDEYLQACGNMW